MKLTRAAGTGSVPRTGSTCSTETPVLLSEYSTIFDAPESSFSYSVQTNAFVEDENQVYWIGTWDGLVRFDYTNRTERRYKFSANNAEGLGSNHILSLYDDDTYLWIGTFSGGLNRMHKETGEITRFTDAQGLASNVIFTIIPGNNGELWLSSNNGVIRFNSVTGSYRNFSESDGLGINDFWWGAGFRSRQGHLYFGSIYGYVTFDPDRIRESRFHPRIVLSEIRVFGGKPDPLGHPGVTSHPELP